MRAMEGKVVVVTGGSAGIGFATAEAFVAAGAEVVLMGRRAEALEVAADRLGDRAWGAPVDVGDADSVDAAFAAVARRHPAVNVLLNVAGIVGFRRLDAMDTTAIERMVRTNYLGPVFTSRAALPLLRAAGGGDIVNVSSEATTMAVPLATIYQSSKAALEAFTRAFAMEVKPEGIRVGCLVVGTTATDIAASIDPTELAEAREVLAADGFFERVGTPMDPAWVAETLLFAVSRPRGQVLDVFHARSFPQGR